MRVIGLTGGIACGKSTVSRWLETQPDCRIIDGDLLSRELCAPGGAALPSLRDCFGDDFFFPDGTLNRRRLASLVFSDASARNKLDQLMSPLLHSLTLYYLQKAREDHIILCFLDFPLLFEEGYDQLCDSVWCVTLPRTLQLQRLMNRDHITEQEALQRMDSVLSSEEKASRSQVIIDNSGEISFTLSLLPPLLEKERAAVASARRRRTDRHLQDNAPSSASSGSTLQTHDASDSFPHESAMIPDSIMKRPASARRKASPRKAAWFLPSWLIWLLSLLSFIVLACFTVQSLMQAYLVRQADKHMSEERAILTNYPLEFRALIEDSASAYNLNPAFVTAIIRNESSFQPKAESSVGARGLMQLMPDTAEWIAGKMKFPNYAFERMFDPESNIRFGCWYLQYLGNMFHGDPVCVACAYHAGQGQVTAWLSNPLLSSDGTTISLIRMADGPTKTYAERVIKAYGIYQKLYFEDSFPAVSHLSSLFLSASRRK